MSSERDAELLAEIRSTSRRVSNARTDRESAKRDMENFQSVHERESTNLRNLLNELHIILDLPRSPDGMFY